MSGRASRFSIRSIVHPEGVQLISDWIDAMAPVNCDAP